jgi:hypothetical protein
MNNLWQVCQEDCVCSKVDCWWKGGLTEGGTTSCKAAEDCKVCAFVAGSAESDGVGFSHNKNERLSALLRMSPLVYGLFPDPGSEGARDKARKIRAELSVILCCGDNRVGCVKQVGALAQLVPKIKDVRLTSGWSEFWNQLRKVGRVVSRQPTEDTQLVALTVLRVILPEQWHPFLSTGGPQETRLLATHFSGV